MLSFYIDDVHVGARSAAGLCSNPINGSWSCSAAEHSFQRSSPQTAAGAVGPNSILSSKELSLDLNQQYFCRLNSLEVSGCFTPAVTDILTHFFVP